MDAFFVQGWSLNPCYSAATCVDGGGYWQYEGWASFAGGFAVELQDTSCGAFGSRTTAQLYAPDGLVYSIGYGTMEDACIDNAEADNVADTIRRKYGIDMAELLNAADRYIDAVAWLAWEADALQQQGYRS